MFLTIGHSNHTWEEFLELLKHHAIAIIADVRHYPSSRKWPQYNKDALQKLLAQENIAYVHLQKLGGRRTPDGSERNAGWEHPAFRGYADYMRTKEFAEGTRELLHLKGRVAIMCAEALPWRCHRRLISDYLTVKKIPVYEIISTAKPKRYELTPFAHVENGELSYPSKQKKLV